MKQAWRKLVAKIDGLSLRERALVFAVAATMLAVLLQTALFDPLFSRQKMLSQRINEQQNKISGIDGEIVQKLRGFDVDPDRASRDRLQQLQQQSRQLSDALRAMEKGLVPPDKIAVLLETILNANGHWRLRLVSLKTLGRSNLNDLPLAPSAAASRDGKDLPAPLPVSPAVPAMAQAPSASSLIYRHGVEIVVGGDYLDLLAYLKALESMPAQLFWGNAKLTVDAYPNTILTLSVYTLSLDQKWMRL